MPRLLIPVIVYRTSTGTCTRTVTRSIRVRNVRVPKLMYEQRGVLPKSDFRKKKNIKKHKFVTTFFLSLHM
jgi:hypothetical protein